MVGSQNSPNYSKEPGGMMSVDNLTKGLILVSARDLQATLDILDQRKVVFMVSESAISYTGM